MDTTIQRSLSFGEVLEAIDQLSSEDQEALVEIVRQRIARSEHERICTEAAEAGREFAAGLCRPVTPDELMDEILS